MKTLTHRSDQIRFVVIFSFLNINSCINLSNCIIARMPGQQEGAVYMWTLSNVVLVMIYCLRLVNNTDDKELRKKEEKSHTKLQYWSEKN